MIDTLRRGMELALLGFVVATAVAAQGPDPVAWWRADGDALDSAGLNDGSLVNGASFGPGYSGQGFLFDGADDYVAVADSVDFDLEEALTVAFWLRYSSCNHIWGWCSLVSKSPNGFVHESHFGVAIQNTGNIAMFIGDGAEICPLEYAGPDLRDGRWHHVAASYDEAVMRYFVDGAQVHSVPCSVPLTRNSEDLEIGAESGESGNAPFGGSIDEVKLFGEALSEDEVMALTVLFGDGFEGGDTTAWSETIIEP